MLPGESVCVKGEHCWVPRCSSAPRPMVATATHANEVIMWGCVELGPATEGFEQHRLVRLAQAQMSQMVQSSGAL